MADFKRVQMIFKTSLTSLARDHVVNTIYFSDAEGPTTFSDQDYADDILEIMSANGQLWAGSTHGEVRVYDMEDAPGPPVAVASGALSSNAANTGPREVALCLSFRGAENVPRQRGRIFIGPFNAAGVRPSIDNRTAVLGLATAFANIGGTANDWCVYSPTSRPVSGDLSPAFFPVKHAWVDDEWDTQRSRGLRATTRSSINLDE